MSFLLGGSSILILNLASLSVSRVARCLLPTTYRNLNSEALILSLLDPRLSTVLRKVVLVILVERHAADELAVAGRLGLAVVVAIRRGGAHDRGALGGHEVVERTHGVAEVVSVESKQ